MRMRSSCSGCSRNDCHNDDDDDDDNDDGGGGGGDHDDESTLQNFRILKS